MWRRTRLFASPQSIHCRADDEQLVAGHIWDRYHARIWDWPGQVRSVAAVHSEYGLTLGVNLFDAAHRPEFEGARDSLFQDLTGVEDVDPGQTANLGSKRRRPYASGRAVVLP